MANVISNAGSAYIFERTNGTWTQIQKIVASDRAADDHFGYSVAISGNYAIVGAYYEDHDASGDNQVLVLVQLIFLKEQMVLGVKNKK